MVLTLNSVSPCCRLTWAMPTRLPAIGICRPLPNCSPRLLSAWSVGGETEHERARHHPAGVLHRAVAQRTSCERADDFRLPRYLAAAARLWRQANGQAALGAGLRRHRRATGLRIPGPSRTGSPKQRAHPQRSARGRPLAVPLRGTAPPGARGHHRTGPRDHALLLVAVQTGLRISELIGLRRGDVHLGVGAHLVCHGKGRKERITPLTVSTVKILRAWLAEHDAGATAPLFPARTGTPLSRDAIEHRISLHVAASTTACPTLVKKKVTAHVLRHTAAMRLLEAGVDPTVIALWLGHERVDTTAIYLHAHLGIKEKALARARMPDAKPGRYRPSDKLLAFLESL